MLNRTRHHESKSARRRPPRKRRGARAALIVPAVAGLALAAAAWIAGSRHTAGSHGLVVAHPPTGIELRRVLHDPNASPDQRRHALADPRVSATYHDEFSRASQQALRKP